MTLLFFLKLKSKGALYIGINSNEKFKIFVEFQKFWKNIFLVMILNPDQT